MRTITYNLKNESNNSDNYYDCIKVFTEKVIKKAEETIPPSITAFEAYPNKTGTKQISSRRELIVEALTLGVLWKAYGDTVICLKPVFRKALAAISKNRGKNILFNRGLDTIKGILITLALSHPNERKSELAIPSTDNIKECLLWLEAFGDFEQEVKRLKHWVSFMTNVDMSNNCNHLKSLIEFADWFEIEGQNYLGKYTYNVANFIKEKESLYRWREDRIFCLRKPIEYHLNMVGAQILSMEYKADFLKASKKKVLLPACMRSHLDSKCRATSRSLGLVCAKCTSGCIVNTISNLGDKNGYEVYIVHHESSAFSNKVEGGIVGVSCVTRLIEGGWKAKELGLPPQCVLLDYCGCKKHWDDNGLSTTLNLSELNKIMQESAQLTPQN